MEKTENKNKSQREQAIEFISKIELPLNVSRTNYIRNMLNGNVITYDDIPAEILENYKFNIRESDYPDWIDRKYNYSFLKTKFAKDKDCTNESACFYKHIKKELNYNDELSAFLAEDYSFWSLWQNNGEKIYSFSKEQILENANIESVSRNMFKLPEGVFFIPLSQLDLYVDLEKENLIEGVYIHNENEESLTINLHFVGNFESVFFKYPDKIVLDEDIVSN